MGDELNVDAGGGELAAGDLEEVAGAGGGGDIEEERGVGEELEGTGGGEGACAPGTGGDGAAGLDGGEGGGGTFAGENGAGVNGERAGTGAAVGDSGVVELEGSAIDVGGADVGIVVGEDEGIHAALGEGEVAGEGARVSE